MNICIDNNRHLRKFFHQHACYKEAIMCDLRERLPILLTLHNGKIKSVPHAFFSKLRVLEYKIIVKSDVAFRVAFTVKDEVLTVIFISEVLIKAHFCKLIAKTDLLD
ncbi:hypothetical protein [Photobacterium angustum]|uniref:hypothetical protein n=1 Tax=Photobacterium angustum TaxID=661 RepID=UPI0005E77A91|nr:hypothetical protein [Photobacterium angustum]KJG01760.1 hypothetical protein UB35_11205 [Photobacterium angustum]PSV65412.1 hypothetical protein CTM95_15660 [Photobacterium angustum]